MQQRLAEILASKKLAAAGDSVPRNTWSSEGSPTAVPAFPKLILRRREVEAATGVRTSRLYELVAAGLFPRPINLSGRAVGWVASEVAAWVAERVQERDRS
jgi:prophage regulatory protein